MPLLSGIFLILASISFLIFVGAIAIGLLQRRQARHDARCKRINEWGLSQARKRQHQVMDLRRIEDPHGVMVMFRAHQASKFMGKARFYPEHEGKPA